MSYSVTGLQFEECHGLIDASDSGQYMSEILSCMVCTFLDALHSQEAEGVGKYVRTGIKFAGSRIYSFDSFSFLRTLFDEYGQCHSLLFEFLSQKPVSDGKIFLRISFLDEVRYQYKFCVGQKFAFPLCILESLYDSGCQQVIPIAVFSR